MADASYGPRYLPAFAFFHRARCTSAIFAPVALQRFDSRARLYFTILPKLHQLSFIGTFAHKLGAALRIDPAELLKIINGPAPASLVFGTGLAKGLHSEVRFLDSLAEKISNDLAAKWAWAKTGRGHIQAPDSPLGYDCVCFFSIPRRLQTW
jgi:hypothetical protein